VSRPTSSDAAQDGEKRKAEILMIQTRGGKPKFYVHYDEFNKRLDEWVDAERIDLSREVEWPAPEKPEKKKSTSAKNDKVASNSKADQKNLKRSRSKLDRELSGTPETVSSNLPGKARRPSKAAGKENNELLVTTEVTDGATPKPEDEELDLVDVQDAAAAAKAVPDQTFSREDEIEKLRTSGSMTQNQTEIARVRNIEKVQMGKFEIEPWYFSPYPIDFIDVDMVYICEFCLSYYGDVTQFERHRSKCTLLHPPGNEIYRDDYVCFSISYSIPVFTAFAINSHNRSLFSKLTAAANVPGVATCASCPSSSSTIKRSITMWTPFSSTACARATSTAVTSSVTSPRKRSLLRATT